MWYPDSIKVHAYAHMAASEHACIRKVCKFTSLSLLTCNGTRTRRHYPYSVFRGYLCCIEVHGPGLGAINLVNLAPTTAVHVLSGHANYNQPGHRPYPRPHMACGSSTTRICKLSLTLCCRMFGIKIAKILKLYMEIVDGNCIKSCAQT